MHQVAPFAGAWIEILSYLLQLVGIVASLPSRERGLKFIKNTFGIKFDRSLPSRERGLKWFVYAAKITGEVVAPFAGAWIEIKDIQPLTLTKNRRSLRGAWIEMSVNPTASNPGACRSLRGSVD